MQILLVFILLFTACLSMWFSVSAETAEEERERELKEQLETSFVVVTHDTQLAKKMDRVLIMENGCLREDKPQ